MLVVQNFIPNQVISGTNQTLYQVTFCCGENIVIASYNTRVANQFSSHAGLKPHQKAFPQFIEESEEFYEVMGLLQGEMSKTNYGKIAFTNTCASLNNKVLAWFESSFRTKRNWWKWYVVINLPEYELELSEQIAFELVEHWMTQCDVRFENSYPKPVHFRKNSTLRVPKNDGALVIEKRNPLFAQTLMNLVQYVHKTILEQPEKNVIAYMKGIIAAESCINYKLETGHRRVFITATDEAERQTYRRCLEKLGVGVNDCKSIKDLVISRKKNLLRLHELGLMTLHPKKHKKFTDMLASYQRA